MDEKLFNWLSEKKIHYTLHSHKAVYTVAEAKEHSGNIPGMHCKNLFLYSSKGKLYFLVTLPATKSINLLELSKRLELKKLSFAKEQDLYDLLHLEPGSVSPLGLVNDINNVVTYVLDREVWEADVVNFHPNINTETLELPKEDFQLIIESLGNKYILMNF